MVLFVPVILGLRHHARGRPAREAAATATPTRALPGSQLEEVDHAQAASILMILAVVLVVLLAINGVPEDEPRAPHQPLGHRRCSSPASSRPSRPRAHHHRLRPDETDAVVLTTGPTGWIVPTAWQPRPASQRIDALLRDLSGPEGRVPQRQRRRPGRLRPQRQHGHHDPRARPRRRRGVRPRDRRQARTQQGQLRPEARVQPGLPDRGQPAVGTWGCTRVRANPRVSTSSICSASRRIGWRWTGSS